MLLKFLRRGRAAEAFGCALSDETPRACDCVATFFSWWRFERTSPSSSAIAGRSVMRARRSLRTSGRRRTLCEIISVPSRKVGRSIAVASVSFSSSVWDVKRFMALMNRQAELGCAAGAGATSVGRSLEQGIGRAELEREETALSIVSIGQGSCSSRCCGIYKVADRDRDGV
jgi:hypothetical protein